MKKFLKWLVFAFLFLFILGWLVRPKEPTEVEKVENEDQRVRDSTNKARSDAQQDSIRKARYDAEYLATVEARQKIKEGKAVEIKGDSVLPGQLADMYIDEITPAKITNIQAALAQKGVAVSEYELLEAAIKIATGNEKKLELTDVLAAYATLRSSGKNHDEAISGAKAVLSTLLSGK